MNAPERHELFVLEDGEKPCVNYLTSIPTNPPQPYTHSVEVTEDTKIPNAATIKVLKQDHTLGNMIRA